MSVEWDYFDKFTELDEKYLPSYGEGNTMATQAITAISKIVYRWYCDGDVYDNTVLESECCNDLSSYANWLDCYTPASPILHRIFRCYDHGTYEDILKDIADILYNEEWLKEMDKKEKVESVYECEGPFQFLEDYEREDEDYY